jgi:RNA polymerase sigma-70 factor (ECF subfamily)
LCARQWTSSQADAEDIVQDAFVRFWRHQRQLDGEPLPLLLISIRRAAYDHARRNIRRTTREGASDLVVDETEPLFEAPVEGDERRAELEAALNRLSPEQREVLVLKTWGELTLDQIAQHLDLSINTVASRYRYALSALKKQLIPTCHGR